MGRLAAIRIRELVSSIRHRTLLYTLLEIVDDWSKRGSTKGTGPHPCVRSEEFDLILDSNKMIKGLEPWQDYPAIQRVLREEEEALGLRRVPGRFSERSASGGEVYVKVLRQAFT